MSYSARFPRLAPNVLVSTASLPTAKYASWTPRTTSGLVTLNLALTFRIEAAGTDGRDYRVEVFASDDFGHTQGFDPAATLRVER